jgi:hypothetical protein
MSNLISSAAAAKLLANTLTIKKHAIQPDNLIMLCLSATCVPIPNSSVLIVRRPVAISKAREVGVKVYTMINEIGGIK